MPREPTKSDKEDLRVGKALEAMLHTDGWKIYQKLLEGHLRQKTSAALSPIAPIVQPDHTVIMPDGVTHVLLGEAAKGAIIGLRLALELPHGIVTQMKDLHQQLFGSNPSDEE